MAFPIHHTQPLEESALQKGVFLWIAHADKIPPHIGISRQGNYFSIQVNGKDDVEVAPVLRAIRLRKVPVLFVQLQDEVFDANRFLAVKNDYHSVNEQVKTCLIPILDLFGQKSSGWLLPDFLKYLKENQHIVAYFSLNLPPDFGGIKSYSLDDVTRHLNKIRDAQRQEHISSRGRTR